MAAVGAPERLAGPLVAALGPGADQALSADPWRLLDVASVTPEQADYCARRALGEAASPDDPRRGRALVRHLLRRAAREGHTALHRPRLEGALRALGVRSTGPAVQAALESGDVADFEVLPEGDDDFEDDEVPELPDPEHHLALAGLGAAEQRLGAGLTRLMGTSEPIMDSATAAETVEATALRLGLDVPAEVTAALVTVALRGVCVLPHGAGARSAIATVVACAAAIGTDSEVGFAVAAPTASAAAALRARLGDAGVEVASVPELLETRGPDERGRDAQRPIEAGLVVVTGAMALDVEAAAALVAACADGTHLVLVADLSEAPSAGAGQVVADLVASRTAAVAPLPADPGGDPVAELAGLVAEGELAEVAAPGHEVVVVPAASAGEAVHRTVQLLTDSIPRALGIAAHDVQILTPTRGGEAGADALNTVCKARLNPGPGAHRGLDPGDRVLLAGHGPGYGPGEVGVLREVSGEGAGVELPGGRAVTVTEASHLRPGWAIPVAAAHGNEWPAVIAVYPPDTRASRPQVYTALTRASRHVSIVQAAGPALGEAVREVARVQRHTRLTAVLREG
nr:helix-hairpin-helix domain-containing protein [Marinactinospora thermotolerans]